MVQMIKEFIGKLFNQKKLNPASPTIFANAPDTVVYKTRTQLIEEGKGRYVCRRHTHGIPTLNKLN